MKIQRVQQTVDRPVGVVASESRVIGEWHGERWNDVPPKARLYVNSPFTVRPLYERGEMVARRWLRNGRAYGSLTGFNWQHPRGTPHLIYSLRRSFNDLSPEDLLDALMQFSAFTREHGANISAPTGTMRSLMAASLTDDVYVRDKMVPIDRLWRGARIERRLGIEHEFHHATLWDLMSAYPSALIDVAIPKRKFRAYVAAPHEKLPEVRSGFVEALVFVPSELRYGPLPDSDWVRARMLFPVDDALTGVWTLDELRAAERAGCTVTVLAFWIADREHRPFRHFGELYNEMRRTLPKDALRIAKFGANGMVGTFAQHGQQQRSAWKDGSEVAWTTGGRVTPRAEVLHALITGAVRARLYDEAIRPYQDEFVSCHTDGAILLGERAKFSRRWRAKRTMQTLYLFDAQHYAYYDETGLHHAVAGMPQNRAESWLKRQIARFELSSSLTT